MGLLSARTNPDSLRVMHTGVRIMRQVGADDAPLLPWVFSDR
jgi:hypothetical protein